ncbi:MAG TPA: hypothetical protein VJA23_02280 [Candidatus Nanoarchaeia archaeon]|nr:hypothetical protein [Candidatus Nanoarchaeia archaeon]
MVLDPKVEEEIRRILWNLSSLKDLGHIISILKLDTQFKPVEKEARISQESLSNILSFPSRIKETRTRIKSIDSTIFKMIYCRKSDLNQINDIVGFIVIVDSVTDCYKLLSELTESGLKPSIRLYDSLDCPPSEYRSLDVNFMHQDHYSQVQIRTTEMQKVYDQGILTPQAYKNRCIKKLRHFLSDSEFGIDYRLALFERIINNFRTGYKTITENTLKGFVTVLEAYSAHALDFTRLYEVRITEETKKVIAAK